MSTLTLAFTHARTTTPPPTGTNSAADGVGSSQSRIHVSHCEKNLATEESRGLSESEWVSDEALMPDQLHPGSAGVAVWLGCLKSEIESALASANGG